jgi:hypothetical protein
MSKGSGQVTLGFAGHHGSASCLNLLQLRTGDGIELNSVGIVVGANAVKEAGRVKGALVSASEGGGGGTAVAAPDGTTMGTLDGGPTVTSGPVAGAGNRGERFGKSAAGNDGTTIGFTAGIPIDARAGSAEGTAAGAVFGVVDGNTQLCAGAGTPHRVAGLGDKSTAGTDGTAIGFVTGIATDVGAGSAEGTALGPVFGVRGALCAGPSNPRRLVAGLVGTDGTAIGFFKGLVRPDAKLRRAATEDGMEMGANLGALAGTPSTGHNQASAFGSKVFTLADRREISIDFRRGGVISNDASSKTVRLGGTSVDATSICGKAGVVTSGGGTAASTGAGLPPSIGGLSDGFERSIRGVETSNVLVHLPGEIFLNKPISNLPGARLWGSTGVSTDSAIRVVVGRLPPRHVYAMAHHAWNSVDSAEFIGR